MDNGMVASDSVEWMTLAELVATLSLVADLGMGRPMERVLRQTVVAMRLGAASDRWPAALETRRTPSRKMRMFL